MRSKVFFVFKFFLFSLVAVLSLNFFYFNASVDAVASVGCFAKAFCVVEESSGRVLFENNSKEKLPMASTTKIMTAITAIESGKDLDLPFEISKKSVGIEGTSIYLQEGEVLTLRKLLLGLMLVSGNDASVAIGEYVGDGVEYFVDMMNEKARKIGAYSSHFENTHGLDEENHYTTAHDLALISAYAMRNPIFKEIVSTKNIQVANEDGKIRYFKNKNKLLSTMDGANGIKTGFTDDAGRCLVSGAERDGMQLVCVVLNCGEMFQESQILLEKGFEDFKMCDLTKDYSYSNSVPVLEGRKNKVTIQSTKNFVYPLKNEEISLIKYEYNILQNISAPIKKGDDVGEIKIFLDKELLFCEKVYTIEEIESKGVFQKIFDILKQW